MLVNLGVEEGVFYELTNSLEDGGYSTEVGITGRGTGAEGGGRGGGGGSTTG